MKEFSYKGKDRLGRKIKGRIEGVNRTDVMNTLRSRRLMAVTLKELKPKRDASETAITWGPFGNIPSKDIMMFTKKISTMVKSGLTIIDSLKMVSDQTENVILRGVTKKIMADVNLGLSLSEAFKKHPRYFDQVYCNMIEAGEMSGKLDDFLERLSSGQERMEKIKAGIKSALFYPITLVVITVVIVWGMLIFVVPTFVKMFQDSGKALPVPTQMIVDASEWISHGSNVLFLILTVAGFITSHKMLLKYVYPYKSFYHSALLKLPLFGNIIVKSSVSALALLMANLFAAGIGIEDILKVGKSVTPNVKFTEALERIEERVVTGVPLSVLFAEEPIFPKDLSQLIQVGESTGNMDEMLTSVARYYQEEFESTVEGLTSMIEPLMIVFVGAMIGGMVVALYLPIFSQGDMIG
jgi:type IV pilus assembly protein PilC|tara:strand:+ start:2813 stop:4042 length:1230 start_codon:yes stop_codon:yes gene_type:complete